MRFIQFLTENDFEDPKPNAWSPEECARVTMAREHEIEMMDATINKLEREGKLKTFQFTADISDELKDGAKYKKITRRFPLTDGMGGIAPKSSWEWITIFVPIHDVQTQRYIKILLDKRVKVSQDIVDMNTGN